MSIHSEFFVIKLGTLEEMSDALNSKQEYYDEGIELIVKETIEEDNIIFYNFLCKGKY